MRPCHLFPRLLLNILQNDLKMCLHMNLHANESKNIKQKENLEYMKIRKVQTIMIIGALDNSQRQRTHANDNRLKTIEVFIFVRNHKQVLSLKISTANRRVCSFNCLTSRRNHCIAYVHMFRCHYTDLLTSIDFGQFFFSVETLNSTQRCHS